MLHEQRAKAQMRCILTVAAQQILTSYLVSGLRLDKRYQLCSPLEWVAFENETDSEVRKTDDDGDNLSKRSSARLGPDTGRTVFFGDLKMTFSVFACAVSTSAHIIKTMKQMCMMWMRHSVHHEQ